MVVTLYHSPISGPSRGALLAARAVGVNVNVQIFDLLKKEQLREDFVKINPQHQVPTLVDGELVLWDSHAIVTYLAATYGKDDSLYPTDPKKRAVVDQRLYFDCGTLHPRIRAISSPIIYLDHDKVNNEHKTSLEEALGFLNIFLKGNDFVAGSKLSVADCSLVASVSNIVAIGWDITPYENITPWINRCARGIPNYAEDNQEGANAFGKAVRSKLAPGQL